MQPNYCLCGTVFFIGGWVLVSLTVFDAFSGPQTAPSKITIFLSASNKKYIIVVLPRVIVFFLNRTNTNKQLNTRRFFFHTYVFTCTYVMSAAEVIEPLPYES